MSNTLDKYNYVLTYSDLLEVKGSRPYMIKLLIVF